MSTLTSLVIAALTVLLVAVLVFLSRRREADYLERLATLDPAKVPAYRLYSPGQIAFATFLGAPIAGAVMMASNYARMNAREKKAEAIWVGVLATGLLFIVALAFGEHLPPAALPVASAGVMWVYAKQKQLPFYMEHVILGGRAESIWMVLGISFFYTFLILLAAFLISLAAQPFLTAAK